MLPKIIKEKIKARKEEKAMRQISRQVAARMLEFAPARDVCAICGCTNNRPCKGGCHWIMPGLCSSCAGVV